MADDTKAKEPEQIVPNEPVPSSESAEVAESVDATDKETEVDLPEGVSERTKEQFNKLKGSNQTLAEENKQLKEQLERRAEIEPIFDAMRNKEQGFTQGQVDQVTSIDPETGTKYIDEQKLDKFLSSVKQEAQATRESLEQDRLKETYRDFPEINPDPTNKQFNRDLYKQFEAIWVHSSIKPSEYGGRPLTYKEAAEIAVKNARQQANVDKEANAQQAAKEQGSLEATGRSDRRSTVNTSEEELRQKIRQGDEDALASFFEES